MGYVYVIGPAEPVTPYRVKIGKADNVQRRLNELQTASAFKLEILWTAQSDRPLEFEHRIHCRLAKYRRIGEWFELGPDPVAMVKAVADEVKPSTLPLTSGERRIAAVLAAAEGPLSSREIGLRCPSLTAGTVRVLLCRMGKEGVVRSPEYGTWELANNAHR